jgi:hypothetical protein
MNMSAYSASTSISLSTSTPGLSSGSSAASRAFDPRRCRGTTGTLRAMANGCDSSKVLLKACQGHVKSSHVKVTSSQVTSRSRHVKVKSRQGQVTSRLVYSFPASAILRTASASPPQKTPPQAKQTARPSSICCALWGGVYFGPSSHPSAARHSAHRSWPRGCAIFSIVFKTV